MLKCLCIIALLYQVPAAGGGRHDRADAGPSTRAATQPDEPEVADEAEVVEIPLLGSIADAGELKWDIMNERRAYGHLFRDMDVVITDGTGHRYRLRAHYVSANAVNGVLVTGHVRPAWPLGPGVEIARRVEEQLVAWDFEITERGRARLDEVRRLGMGRGTGMFRIAGFEAPGDLLLMVRISPTRNRGYSAVFEFALPDEKRQAMLRLPALDDGNTEE